jgi:hypothetical protein
LPSIIRANEVASLTVELELEVKIIFIKLIIGISKHLLSKWFQKVDLIDQCEKYIETAKVELKDCE